MRCSPTAHTHNKGMKMGKCTWKENGGQGRGKTDGRKWKREGEWTGKGREVRDKNMPLQDVSPPSYLGMIGHLLRKPPMVLT